MKPCHAIIFLPLLIGVVSGYCNQYSELERLRRQIRDCESGETPYHVFRLFRQMSSETLTFEQIEEELRSFCNQIPSKTIACFSQHVNAREDCQEMDEIQSLLNFHMTSWYATNVMCANNATRYLDIGAGDGPTCYANNDSHRQCLSQSKYELIFHKIAPNSNRNMCGILDATNDCLSAYDSCENRNVRIHWEYINQQLQHQFGCLNTY